MHRRLHIRLLAALVSAAIVAGVVLADGTNSAGTGPASLGGASAPVGPCITPEEYQSIRAQLPEFRAEEFFTPVATVYFEDPMGNGGINSPCNPVVNYVDLQPGDGILDYMCGEISYDGHQGFDINIRDFYEMDEGVAILAAADGVVLYSHDGEFDRRTEGSGDANAVIVGHADGSHVWYWHMRKNSVRVAEGDYVYLGDTLGLIGSSGWSTAPHLHFEIDDGGVVPPYSGPCQPEPTRWVEQTEYVLDLPLQLITSGVTTLPVEWKSILERPPSHTHITAPATINTWIMVRGLKATTALSWKLYVNESLWNEGGFTPGWPISLSWWLTVWNLPSDPSYYGDWCIETYADDDLLIEHSFTYDGAANQPPVFSDSTLIADEHGLSGEFAAVDGDGSIFWYDEITPSSHGTLIQDGGRRRKFTYVPDIAYTADQVFQVQALDDDSAASPIASYTFQLGAAFTANPTYGWAPLPVDFTSISGLSVDTWTWDFGDGDSADVQHPSHTYTSGGAYDVELQISAGTDVRSTSKTDYIVVLADTLKGQDSDGQPGHEIEVVINARNSIPISQFLIPVEWDGDLELAFDSVSTVGCRTEYFEQQAMTNFDGYIKRLTMDLQASAMGSSPDLPPGDGPVLKVHYTIAPGALPEDTTIIQLDGYYVYLPEWTSPLATFTPALTPSVVTIGEEPSCCVHRGDINHDGTTEPDIADLVYLVTYMFQDGPAPVCDEPAAPDCPEHYFPEADVNGDGTCVPDIADLVYLVTYMFQDGPALVPCS